MRCALLWFKAIKKEQFWVLATSLMGILPLGSKTDLIVLFMLFFISWNVIFFKFFNNLFFSSHLWSKLVTVFWNSILCCSISLSVTLLVHLTLFILLIHHISKDYSSGTYVSNVRDNSITSINILYLTFKCILMHHTFIFLWTAYLASIIHVFSFSSNSNLLSWGFRILLLLLHHMLHRKNLLFTVFQVACSNFCCLSSEVSQYLFFYQSLYYTPLTASIILYLLLWCKEQNYWTLCKNIMLFLLFVRIYAFSLV